eukprot:scaffold318185_cov39-Tisochrysis_lutea.AAC.1
MLIRGEEVVQMHERIKACAASSSDAITVLILVAVDADAVAACAMLTVSSSLAVLTRACGSARGKHAGVPEPAQLIAVWLLLDAVGGC